MSTSISIRTPWSREPWTRAAVYGFGASGCAAAALLRAAGVKVVLWDDRDRDACASEALQKLEADPSVVLHCAADAESANTVASSVDALVVSPGVPVCRPLVAAAFARRLPVIAEVELAFAQVDSEAGDVVVAVTGSNGKSTTTALAGALFAAAGHETAVCGNFGPPFSGEVAKPRSSPHGRTYVVELSSFQLEATDTFRPRAAALLNLSADHIDRHGDLAAYRAAKVRIFDRQGGDDVAVINGDDRRIADVAVPGRRRLFSRRGPVDDGCYLAGDAVLEKVPGAAPTRLFGVGDVPIPGTHNLENAMAAALLARGLAIEPDTITRALREFRGLPHRLERVATANGVTFYDDSKGTNVGATIASLDGFGRHEVHLILGGLSKGADFTDLVAPVVEKARAVYVIGEAAEQIAATIDPHIECVRAGDLDSAVALSASAAQPGEHVVLSPACASFDQFSSFVARGEAFQRAVRALAAEAARKEAHNGA